MSRNNHRVIHVPSRRVKELIHLGNTYGHESPIISQFVDHFAASPMLMAELYEMHH